MKGLLDVKCSICLAHIAIELDRVVLLFHRVILLNLELFFFVILENADRDFLNMGMIANKNPVIRLIVGVEPAVHWVNLDIFWRTITLGVQYGSQSSLALVHHIRIPHRWKVFDSSLNRLVELVLRGCAPDRRKRVSVNRTQWVQKHMVLIFWFEFTFLVSKIW